MTKIRLHQNGEGDVYCQYSQPTSTSAAIAATSDMLGTLPAGDEAAGRLGCSAVTDVCVLINVLQNLEVTWLLGYHDDRDVRKFSRRQDNEENKYQSYYNCTPVLISGKTKCEI